MSRPKPSRWGRLAQLGQLTTRVGSSYVGQRLKEAFSEVDAQVRERLHRENADRVVETLGQLKGVAMKAGQSIAMLAGQLDLPAEIRQRLDQLNARAERVPFDLIRAAIEEELEAPLGVHFAFVDPEPLGTASLGQAHAATLFDGTEVVVKVRHEGVERDVDADLLALRGLMLTGRAAGRDRAELDAIYDEVRARLLEELDYLQEAANLHTFRGLWEGDPRVLVPRLFPDLCTGRLLVMERLRGASLDEFLATATPEARRQAGLNLADLVLESTFVHRTLHADPHPGNYLFGPDGQVQVLDFGCVKRFDPYWIGHYARAVLAALDGDRAGVLSAARDLGGWVGHGEEAAEAIWQFCDALVGPLRLGEHTIGGPEDRALVRIQPALRELWRHPDIRGQRDVVYLHRTLGGVYAMCRRLEVRDDWSARLRPVLRTAIAVFDR
jgi:predicted unusual protein kinase regulating ubiquinone biosynthesis (AarF/ABC1/UbiB family)